MLTPVERRFEGLRRERARFLSEIEGWSEDRAQAKPLDSGWCVTEVMDHIVRVEQSALASINRNLAQGQNIRPGDFIRRNMVVIAMRLPVRVKVPADARSVHPLPLDLESAIKQWSESEASLATQLGSIRNEQLRAGVFQHPIGGWMTIPQTLLFLSEHVHHHRFQLRRLARVFEPI